MQWNETIAQDCSYGDVAERIFGNCEIIWESAEGDYSGSCNILGQCQDGTFIHYEWSWGSCSECDEWEARGLSDDEIEQEMRQELALLPDRERLLRYLKVGDSEVYNKSCEIMECQDDTSEFEEMRVTALKWLKQNKE